MYYKRFELQWRLTIFFMGSVIAGAFGGVSQFDPRCSMKLISLSSLHTL